MDKQYSVRCSSPEHIVSDSRFFGQGIMPFDEAVEAMNALNDESRAVGRDCQYVLRAAEDVPVLTEDEVLKLRSFVAMEQGILLDPSLYVVLPSF